MSLVELLVIAVALAMDAVAVSLALGLQLRRPRVRESMLAAGMFGLFQALMPVLGWGLSFWFAESVAAVTPWLAFGLLALVGGHMLTEGVRGGGASGPTTLTVVTLLPLAVATSLDAAAVGVTFAFLEVAVLPAMLLIGLVTLALAWAAVVIGARAGEHLGGWAEVAGGAVLIAIGLRILLTHLL